ncbi:histidine utilization repressor [Novosphingobium sp. SG720]|uniref:histidine utilization repressor n=1 Tax=Novosphingobium TaxID=165696 RepID=UPI0014462E44|nr:histidine utilization repressor [Novosphingobium sp. SG720]NKJ44666.1 GntR family histidine utilization transcriptional repressor [Novosphingobium sp. SG720]
MTASTPPLPAALPMHERIRQEIEARVMAGELRPGERIPSELELMAHYGCARMTVNKALSRLAESGLLERRKRAGTFVARPRTVSMVLDIPDLALEVQGRGQVYGFRLLSRSLGDTASDREAAAELGDVGPILRLSGLHLADGAPLAVEERVTNLALVPGMADVDFTADPPGGWLLRHIPWTEAENRIGALAASREQAKALGIPAGSPCLVVARHTWRGADSVTFVRQVFVAGAYELVARFGPAR